MDMKHLILAIAAGLAAGAKALTEYASSLVADGAAAPAAGKAGKGAAGKAGKAATPPADDGLGGDGGLDDGLGGGDGGLDDGLGGDAPAKPAGPTIEQVREKLLALKAKDGNTNRVTELMKKAINDASKQPTVPNIPAEKYAAVVAAVDKLLAK